MTREDAAEAAELTRDARLPLGLPRPVLVLSAVSFLTDISSEMVYPLIPLFLTSSLGAPVAAVGLIEGVAESAASVLKTLSGRISDRLRVRKPLVVAGYGLSAIAKPLMALAFVWPAALLVRFVDRAGKGIRTAPRDALVADATPAEVRGRAFGFHRAADTAGAVIGPLIGLGLFVALDERYRLVFLIAGIPAAAGLVFLAFLRERKPPPGAPAAPSAALRELGRPFYVFLGISLIFALGNSSDAFIILRAKDLGLSTNAAIASYALFNVVYALGATPAGDLSDRVGRRRVIGPGFLAFSIVYLGFAVISTGALVWPLFALYGVFMALTEGVGRALVADFVPAAERATALGVYTGATGAMILVSSLLAGVLWDVIGPSAPFYLGATTGILALLGLVVLRPKGSAVGGRL